MRIGTYHDVARKNLLSGTVVWACWFKENGDKSGKKYYQLPVKGMLTASNQDPFNQGVKQTDVTPQYFVPFKKNSNELAWSKAVSICARVYATTEEDCKEMYNELIHSAIAFHDKRIYELQQLLIK